MLLACFVSKAKLELCTCVSQCSLSNKATYPFFPPSSLVLLFGRCLSIIADLHFLCSRSFNRLAHYRHAEPATTPDALYSAGEAAHIATLISLGLKPLNEMHGCAPSICRIQEWSGSLYAADHSSKRSCPIAASDCDIA